MQPASRGSSLGGDEVRHLFRRLTFAATPAAERAARGHTAGVVLDSLITPARKAPMRAPPEAVRGLWTNSALRVQGMTTAQYDARRAEQVRSNRVQIEAMRQWWLGAMIAGPARLRENLTLFFHGLFGSSSNAVDAPQALHGCNALLRRACLGTFPALLADLVLDPAMMIQIGMDEHGQARVSDRPAKLILDHWTVGPGGYADRDVEELSRALTGWVLTAPPGTGAAGIVDPGAPRIARRTGLVPIFVQKEFDAGTKTILGTTRAFDARSAIRFLAHQPATARRLARHLLQYLGVEDARQRLEQSLVATYRTEAGSIEALLREIVRSEEFWSAESRWTLIKSPVHLAVGACRQLEIAAPPLGEISQWLAAAGQTLFDTPNSGEGGWPGQEAWVTPPDRLAVRYQLPRVLSGRMPELGIRRATATGTPAQPFQLMLAPALQKASPKELLARLDPAPGVDGSTREATDLIRHVMATPQYQLA